MCINNQLSPFATTTNKKLLLSIFKRKGTMKISKIALLLGIVFSMTTGILRADVSLFGSVEQGLKVLDNGASEVVANGTIIGAKVDSQVFVPLDVASGLRVFGTLSADIDPSGANAITTRDAFIGIGLGDNIKVSVGRMQNIQDTISEAIVGIFAEDVDLKSRNASRDSKTAKATVSLGGVSVVGATIIDGSVGEERLDSWEVGTSLSAFGLNLVTAYAKDENSGTRTILGGANHTLGPVTLGGIFEQDKTSSGTTTETATAVASITVGKNALKAGYQNIFDGGADTYLGEAEHSFSSNASAFANVRAIRDTSNSEAYTVGFRLSF